MGNMETPEKYDVIEVLGQTALFSNDRIAQENLPKGLYKYDLRHGDSGDFVSVEPRVAVNHAGTIITKELIDFGEKGYISFTDGTSPNFLGKKLTFAEYMSGDFEFEEEQNTSMEDMQL